MALYAYTFNLRFTGANATVLSLVAAINQQLGPVRMEIDDTQIATVRTQLTAAGLQPINIKRTLIVNSEDVS
jgi:hypothetical protein